MPHLPHLCAPARHACPPCSHLCLEEIRKLLRVAHARAEVERCVRSEGPTWRLCPQLNWGDAARCRKVWDLSKHKRAAGKGVAVVAAGAVVLVLVVCDDRV
eukprot:365449-Chlamydomonas_euryale.AAC.8